MRFTAIAMACLLLGTAWTEKPHQGLALAENANRESLLLADEAWAKVVASKDIERYMKFVAEDAKFVNDGEILDRAKIRNMMSGLFAKPYTSIRSKAETVAVSQSGELGYTVGWFRFKTRTSKGADIEITGKYADVWRRTPKGAWKVILDISSATPAP